MTKTHFDKKLASFNKQVTSNKTKHLEVQKKLDSLIIKHYNFFLGRIFLEVMMDLKTCLLINQELK